MLKMVSSITCYCAHAQLGLLPFHSVSYCDYTYKPSVLYRLDLHDCLYNDIVCTFKIFSSNDRVNDSYNKDLGKLRRNPRQQHRFLGPDANRKSSEYKPEALPLESIRESISEFVSLIFKLHNNSEKTLCNGSSSNEKNTMNINGQTHSPPFTKSLLKSFTHTHTHTKKKAMVLAV